MKPKVILFVATSLDGRTTGFSVNMGLFYSLAQQWSEDASLVGCDTLLNAPDEIPEATETVDALVTPSADDPRPILVVPDSRGRLKSWHYWKQQPYWKDWISLCTEDTPPDHMGYLKHQGVKVLTAGKEHVDFGQVLGELNRQFKVKVIRVDSGGMLNTVLLRAGLVDELHLLVHPILVGGIDRKTFFSDLKPEVDREILLQLLDVNVQAQGILLLSYEVLNEEGEDATQDSRKQRAKDYRADFGPNQDQKRSECFGPDGQC